MSVIQVEDLVSYQLRTSYLSEIADGVGERLLTINENFLHSAPFKSAGWRPNPALIRRTHSPPIPTGIASEYFQAPRPVGLTLEDEADEGGLFTGGGPDAVGPGQATKRRRRRHQMEEDDSSDVSDLSDDEPDQRAAQQIKFAKMPVRNRSGSSPIQSTNLRQMTTVSPAHPDPHRRASQSALEVVKERMRRDTVTSSEVSSDNDLDSPEVPLSIQREASVRSVDQATGSPTKSRSRYVPTLGIPRQSSDLLDEDEEEDSDASDMSAFVESIDSVSILDVVDNTVKSPREQVVGTPPREFTRRSTIRRSAMPAPLQVSRVELPPPRPASMIRPISMMQPKSLLTAALKAKKTKPTLPFDRFASLSGQGDPNPIQLRIYAPFSKSASKPFEVSIRRTVHDGEGHDRTVTVADLIGLSLWKYNEEKLEPGLPSDKLNVNWWALRMVEEDGEVDDDFPPLERTKQLISFTTANNRAGRARSNSKVYDMFALSQASADEYEDNQAATPEFSQEDVGEEDEDKDTTPRNTPKADAPLASSPPRRLNPVIHHRPNAAAMADTPQPMHPAAAPNTQRGEPKLLRIHIHSQDAVPGQMVALDVTTDQWLNDVLDKVCKRRQLDKANHVLKLEGSGTIVYLDRTVASLGNTMDLGLYRRRFATDGPLTMTGSPSSASPRAAGLQAPAGATATRQKPKLISTHPLAREALKLDELSAANNYRKYTVWRKERLRMMLMTEKLFTIDGEYIHIMPAHGGQILEGGGKMTTVHFSNLIGCKLSRKHRSNFKLVVFKTNEQKRYEFVAKDHIEAEEIVQVLKKGILPYREI